MSTIDYNIDNYTITELFAILGLDDPTATEIIDSTNKFIDRFQKENQPILVNFFQTMQTKLMRYMNELETSGTSAEYTPNETQTEEWFKYEALPQSNEVQKNKITDRIQKIDVYDNNHVPMNREQLGINNNFNVKVAQDTLNPNLENTTSRFINLDSQFRQSSGGAESMSTDYTLDLSDPLTNVLNMRLYSVQIPYTWYTIDYMYGNTCFWITNTNNGISNTFTIFLEPGNYDSTSFCLQLQKAFTTPSYFKQQNSLWTQFTYTGTASPEPPIAKYNTNNGKITLYLDGWTDPALNPLICIDQSTGTAFNAGTDAYFTFFDLNGTKSCYESGTNSCAMAGQGQTFNGTLGWLMGFRLPIQPIYTADYTNPLNYTGGNTPVAVLNLYGPKYFILVLDDYNQNHINNGLITITELSKTLALPSYYNTSQPYICTTNNTSLPAFLDPTVLGNLANMNGEIDSALGINPTSFYNSLQDKLDFGTSSIPQLLPSAPRTLTQAQIYTINEIIKNRNKTISYRSKAPTNSDTFALIPIKYSGLKTGDIYVDFSGSIQDNKRIYFGPVDIDRMRVRLLDDRGNVMDLHGADWCITLISENLYQY